MTTSNERNRRTGTVQFANGSVSFTVEHWSNGAGVSKPADLDHIMGELCTAFYAGVAQFNEVLEASESGIGVTKYATARTVTVGASLRVKMTVRLNRPLPSMLLAYYVEGLLAKVVACMLHTIDSNAKQDVVDWMNDLVMSTLSAMFAVAFAMPGSNGAGFYAGANTAP
ncbi:MAG TPA: hypothetical protein VIQ80_01530 [Candidatus Saccharimonadales bacterium]